MRDNLESQRRQYEFAEQAAAMGWSAERILVIDEDQGKSGAIPQARAGFANLVAAVARREAGIVMSLELSRLSRNDADWHHLVYLCRWTDTLIADEHGVYDPSSSADRMVLGVRGQVSELERDNCVHRMVEARWSKARRGEAFTIPPAGYELDELGQWVLTSDEAVVNVLHRVFEKFDELGATRQVFLWWRDEGLPFPVRRIRPRHHSVVWVPVRYRLVYQTLRHPIYASAYVFGRSATKRELDPETQRLVVGRTQRAMRDWPVLIKDHHPAYISFAKFLDNQERMRGNHRMSPADESQRGAAHEGRALLQGLVRCGHCGRRMYVGYGGERAARTLQYRCSQPRAMATASPECQLVGGKRIEAVVVEAFLQATQAAGPEAAALAGETLRAEVEAAERSWRLQIEKAEYEAQRAERQYMAVEPENRTVARELERRWNERLAEVEALRTKAAQGRERRRSLSERELVQAQELGKNLEAVWNAATTTVRDRKLLLRALIEEVQLRTEEKRHRVRVLWKGGATTDREVARLRGGQHYATSEETVELVRKLALEFDDAQIARILNRQGRRSGLGLAFTKSSVLSLRGKNRISICPKKLVRDERQGPFTADEAARELGVAPVTVHRWLREGVLAGEQATARAPWRIVLTEEVRRRLAEGVAPQGWVGLSEAARRLGVSKPLVAHLVKQGKLRAVRTTVGKRECWRIDVSSTDYAAQRPLFDQINNTPIKES